MRVGLLLAALGLFVLVAHSTYVHLSSQKKEAAVAPSPVFLAEGMTMPEELPLETLDGKKTTVGDLKGKVLLINFWAGWCAPCLHEMPGLFALQKTLADKGVVVLGVNMDEDPRVGMLALTRAAGAAPFTIYKGLNSPLADRFPIEGLPFTVVVDKGLRIAYAHAGEVNWSRGRALELVEKIL
jgi:thiol-disulfide isomerase/thioredoxin